MKEDFDFPAPVMGFFDPPLWESIEQRSMRLQKCAACATFVYPPGPVCPACLSEKLEWTPVGGKGTILSWIVYHRQYFESYPAPYNAIAVRLDEGPIFVSNLEGEVPAGSWIGRRVSIHYAGPTGKTLPRFVLDTSTS